MQRLRDRLKDEPYVVDIRGEGLMIGVELTADRDKRTFFAKGTYPHRVKRDAFNLTESLRIGRGIGKDA